MQGICFDYARVKEIALKKINSILEIANNYKGILFDAFGVLINESGALPGAVDILNQLAQEKIPYWVLTNGSSKTVAESVNRYQELGLPVDIEQVISSGGLLAAALDRYTVEAEQVAVLGATGSFELVRQANRVPVSPIDNKDYRVVVIANQVEFPFIPSIDATLTRLIQGLDRNEDMKLILTNPDLFYPKSQHEYGITAGSLSLILEESLKLRFGARCQKNIIKLGKPYSPIFEEAKLRAGSSELLMVGDQIYTDILGAKQNDLDSLLLGTGLSSLTTIDEVPKDLLPDYYCSSIRGGE